MGLWHGLKNKLNNTKMNWIICINDYIIDGNAFTMGTMIRMEKGCRGFHENYWRFATKDEVANKKWFKGIQYNLDSFR